MMLGTSHIRNKYIDVTEYCHDDNINSTTNSALKIKERIAKQKKSLLFLDDVSLERVIVLEQQIQSFFFFFVIVSFLLYQEKKSQIITKKYNQINRYSKS